MKDAAQIRECFERVSESLARRAPEAKADPPSRAVWQGGLAVRLVTDKPQVFATDMPAALGGEDQAPSPGWYFRCGAASCLATTIALHAAARGVVLRRLEVEATTESDTRGLLGCGEAVPPGPQRMRMDVLIEADGAPAGVLEELVAYADAHAPMSGALRRPLALSTRIRGTEEADR